MCGIAGTISFVDDMREEMKICEQHALFCGRDQG